MDRRGWDEVPAGTEAGAMAPVSLEGTPLRLGLTLSPPRLVIAYQTNNGELRRADLPVRGLSRVRRHAAHIDKAAADAAVALQAQYNVLSKLSSDVIERLILGLWEYRLCNELNMEPLYDEALEKSVEAYEEQLSSKATQDDSPRRVRSYASNSASSIHDDGPRSPSQKPPWSRSASFLEDSSDEDVQEATKGDSITAVELDGEDETRRPVADDVDDVDDDSSFVTDDDAGDDEHSERGVVETLGDSVYSQSASEDRYKSDDDDDDDDFVSGDDDDAHDDSYHARDVDSQTDDDDLARRPHDDSGSDDPSWDDQSSEEHAASINVDDIDLTRSLTEDECRALVAAGADLNKLDDAALASMKAYMAKSFDSNAIRPGDASYKHDIRQSFDTPKEPSPWDDTDEESDDDSAPWDHAKRQGHDDQASRHDDDHGDEFMSQDSADIPPLDDDDETLDQLAQEVLLDESGDDGW